MDIGGLFCDILKIVPGIVLGICATVYCTLKYTLYSRVEKNRASIRLKVANKWTTEYKTFTNLIDNVDVKYIRALVKKIPNEDKALMIWRISFVVLSFVAILTGIVLNRVNELNKYHGYLLVVETVLYCVILTLVLLKSYYELRFYQLLDELDKLVGEN